MEKVKQKCGKVTNYGLKQTPSVHAHLKKNLH